ncbi:MAG: hypothetical protein HGA27_07295, partial [Peptococcaceae bacterium]|nr:hypothetical protein [Peptococcaceae bacterium]
MKFKRKFRGYDIEETDILIEELVEKENRVLEKEEELLTLLTAEGEALEQEFQRLSQLLEKSRERNLQLANFQSTLETLFLSIEKEGDLYRKKILSLSNNTASEQDLSDTFDKSIIATDNQEIEDVAPAFRAMIVDDDPTILAMLKAI